MRHQKIEDLKLPELIRHLRENHGISQQKLAELLGTKQQVISKYEQPGYNFSVRTLARIAKVLGGKISIRFV